MKLKDLIKNLPCKVTNFNGNLNIENLFFDSREKSFKGLFFCLYGVNTNGENFVAEAIKNGAIAIVTHTKLDVQIPQIIVENTRKALSIVASNFYHNPEKQLKIIGITGTNGKTSTSYILAKLLRGFGKKVGVIGTSGVFVNGKKYSPTLTTPDSTKLFEIFSQMVKQKVEFVVMEVSAHAIALHKVFGIEFVQKILTNVSVDHLDFFETVEHYKNTKLQFFETGKNFVVNFDDEVGKQIKQQSKNKTLSYGINLNSDLKILNENCGGTGTRFQVSANEKIYDINSHLLGKFNVQNIACAIASLLQLGFDVKKMPKIISRINCLLGRFESVKYGQKFCVIVDYAHTVESLKNLLLSVKEISSKKNIIVFGCPGERDSTKRAQMGKIAGELCNVVIATTDNPASENARRIMFEIASGVKKTKAKCLLIENRKRAIKKAVSLCDANCNLLVVGKGNEQYQIIGDNFVPYSDYEVLKSAIKNNK